MRTVRGRADHVVVVGAGLGGLSAAMRLAGAGRRVTVVEREAVPGGRAGVLVDGGYTFDTGPTVLTMPDLLASCFDALGESMSSWLTLDPVVPLYRSRFADGSVIDVRESVDAMAAEIASVCGPGEADGYRRWVDFVSALYRLEMRHFIDRNLDSPLSMLTPSLARLVALGGFRRLAPTVERHFRDPRLQRLFSFQAMYAGLSPYRALAIYAVISYMDTVAGVFHPRGGMHAVPRAMADAATKHGVDFRFGETVTSVEMRGDRAVAVVTSAGRIPCDAVVLNPDLPAARRLVGRPLRRRLRYSPSCVVLHVGSARPADAHHTISFGHAWREVFAELHSGRVMSDPSFFVSAPPGAAPPGRTAYYLLFPTPNASVDWGRYVDSLWPVLESRGFDLDPDVVHVTTPVDWAARGMEGGTPFAAAHTFTQTGPFRPGNLLGDNVVFAGSGTVPGVGVPMVLVSGRLAAERILGRP